MKLIYAFALLVGLCLAHPASAMVWNESANGGGDAGETPATAQIIPSSFELNAITGSHQIFGERADLFSINLVDPGSFSASLDYLNTAAPYLYLFDASGAGLAFASGTSSGAGLPAVIGSGFISGPGRYLLGATNTRSTAITAAGLEIWNTGDGLSARAPDGPGANGTVADFRFNNIVGGNYTITLTGTNPANISAVPEPSTLALLGGLGVAAVGRRTLRQRSSADGR